jgi:hypothetical protein
VTHELEQLAQATASPRPTRTGPASRSRSPLSRGVRAGGARRRRLDAGGRRRALADVEAAPVARLLPPSVVVRGAAGRSRCTSRRTRGPAGGRARGRHEPAARRARRRRRRARARVRRPVAARRPAAGLARAARTAGGDRHVGPVRRAGAGSSCRRAGPRLGLDGPALQPAQRAVLGDGRLRRPAHRRRALGRGRRGAVLLNPLHAETPSSRSTPRRTRRPAAASAR